MVIFYYNNLKINKKLKINKNKLIAKFPKRKVIGYKLKKKNNKLSIGFFFLKVICFFLSLQKLVAGDGFEPPTFRL